MIVAWSERLAGELALGGASDALTIDWVTEVELPLRARPMRTRRASLRGVLRSRQIGTRPLRGTLSAEGDALAFRFSSEVLATREELFFVGFRHGFSRSLYAAWSTVRGEVRSHEGPIGHFGLRFNFRDDLGAMLRSIRLSR